jgi:hypothetical protein
MSGSPPWSTEIRPSGWVSVTGSWTQAVGDLHHGYSPGWTPNADLQPAGDDICDVRLVQQVLRERYTPNLYAYSLATSNQQYGYAAAVSFVLGIVIAGASYIFTLITNRRRPEQ